MNFKKLTAFALVATMVLGSSITAFADEGVLGAGVVEYDDSEAIVYDKVTVPTMVASTYEFQLDPTGLLSKYMPDDFDSNYSVYFTTVSPRANVKAAQGVTLATKALAVKAAVNGEWTNVADSFDDGLIDALVANKEYYVWTVGEDGTGQNKKYESGLPGKAVPLTAENINYWFEMSGAAEAKKIKLKSNYLVETATYKPIDGNIYEYAYTNVDAPGITDSDTDPLDNYVTFTESDLIDEAINLYKVTDGTPPTYAPAEDADIVYTPAENAYKNETDTFTVTNKSTKSKVITAKITAKNVKDITFKDDEDYTGDTSASMFIQASGTADDSAAVALEKEDAADEEATATYTVTLAPKTNGEDGEGNAYPTEITYMTKGTNANSGGHAYNRYEAYGNVYSSDSFKITASANKDAEDAWNAWAAKVTSTARPGIKVVYDCKDAPTEEEQADAAATEAANTWKTTHAEILAKTTENVEYADLAAINAALAAYEALSEAAQGKVTTQKALLDSLKTAAEALADRAPSISTTTYTVTSGQPVVVNVDMGAGNLKATGIASITFVKNGNTNTLGTDKYSYSDGKITFTAAYAGAITADRAHTVTFSDDAGTTAVITIKP